MQILKLGTFREKSQNKNTHLGLKKLKYLYRPY